MNAIELLEYGLRRTRNRLLSGVARDHEPDYNQPPMERDQLVWRPAPGSHSVGILLWHIVDVEEHWLSRIRQETFQPRFGLRPFDAQRNEEIPSWSDLMGYLEEERVRTLDTLRTFTDQTLDEDRDFYGNPLAAGKHFTALIQHETTHAGQILHIMGMLKRSGW